MGNWGRGEPNQPTLDIAFAEDDRPWIVAGGNSLLVMLVLRRIAYSLLPLFRSVSLRSEQKGAIRWGDLLRWVWSAVVAATDAYLEAIRPRAGAVIWS